MRVVLSFPAKINDVHQQIWQVGFPKYPAIGSNLSAVEDRMRQSVNDYSRILDDLPDLMTSTDPSPLVAAKFEEVFGAFKREASSCYSGLRELRRYLESGMYVPVEGGGTVLVPFSEVYFAVDITESKKILQMACEEIVQLFPIDEAEDARNTTTMFIEEYIMGDKFENIQNSTIINKSIVQNALNKASALGGEDVEAALKEIAAHVDESGNVAAGAVLNQFADEVNRDQPDRSRLRQYWDGLVTILPSVASLGSAAAAIAKLFV